MILDSLAEGTQNNLDKHFVSSWIYSASLQIVEQSDSFLRQTGSDPSPSYLALRAETIDLARTQIEKIAISAGHLPRDFPFDATLDEPPDTIRRPTDSPSIAITARVPVSHQDILAALASSSACDKLHTDLLHRAIADFRASGRARSAQRLQTNLFMLEQCVTALSAEAYQLTRRTDCEVRQR